MDITLISHASVLIKTEDCTIWTDPWLTGTAFNESWALSPPAASDSVQLDAIDYIWISHEHPDHFHIPTLKSLPDSFKEEVVILYQDNNSSKMVKALQHFGFKKFTILPNRQIISIAGQSRVYCHQVGAMDSALGVLTDTETLLNINDCECNTKDCHLIKKDIGAPDMVLNQFSIAGYGGHVQRESYLPRQAAAILRNCSSNHRDLSAGVTLPFASFVYFCQSDNNYINHYHNSAIDFAEHMQKEKLDVVILYPGDTCTVNSDHDNSSALEKFAAIDRDAARTITTSPVKSIEEIQAAYLIRFKQIRADFSLIFRYFLKPVSIEIADLDKKIEFSFRTQLFREIEQSRPCDLAINSQPLWFCFQFPFGVQTLGVSARYTLYQNFRNWKLHRALFSLNNAEIYLSKRFFKVSNLIWFRDRFVGFVNQFFYQLKRMV